MHLGLPLILLACAVIAGAGDAAPPVPPGAGPIMMLKLDDVTRVSERWKRTADFLEAEGVKANFGVIGEALEKEDPVLKAWVADRRAKNLVEFWNHGYASRFKVDEASGKKGEFNGTGLEAQLKALTRTQELGKLRFGFEFAAYGPHSSATDADTYAALAQIPALKLVWFYAPKPPATTTAFVVERRMELEKPLFVPNPDAVKERFEKLRGKDYLAVQGHPDQWDDARFAAFQVAVRYLKAQGCRFAFASEFLAGRK